MRSLLIALAVVISVIGSSAAQSDPLLAAREAFQSGDYPQAVDLLNSVPAERRDGAFYVNLASAQQQIGDLPGALINLLRAQQMLPRDAEIAEALARVRAQLSLRSDADHENPVIQLGTLTNELMTLTELTWLSFALWVLAWLLLIFRLRDRRQLTWLHPAILAVWLTCAAAIVLYTSRAYITDQQPLAVVVAQGDVHSGPDVTYPRIGLIPPGQELRSTSSNNGWTQYLTPDGSRGWIATSSLTFIDPR